MNLKVYFVVTCIVIITFYIIFLGLRLCEPFVANDNPIKAEILKAQNNNMNLSKYYQDITNTLYANLASGTSVDDAVGDANLPYAMNVYNKDIASMQNKNNEYIIIASYKKILNRNPTEEEINKHLQQFDNGELDEKLLQVYLLNSTEYMINAKVQSNEVLADMEYAYAKHDIIAMITRMYFEELHAEAPKAMLLPLRDIFMFLENDKYLFRAFLIDSKYKNFEEEILGTRTMKKENILEVFNKYYVYDSLKLKANDIRRYDAVNRVNSEEHIPESIPANTNFQGANLNLVEQNLGAGSGAQQATVSDQDSALRAYTRSLIQQ